MNKIMLVVTFFGLVAGQDTYNDNYNDVNDNDFPQEDEYQGHQSDDKDYHSEPHYSFGYEVHDDHTGDIKSHYEERKGDHTQGMYTLVEPGGSKRVVQYFVKGKSGFVAKVEREETKHPHGPFSSRGYHDEAEAPTPSRGNAPLRQYDDDSPRQYDDTPPRHYDDGPRRHYDETPRRHYDETPRRHYDDAPRRHYDDAPRRHYDDTPSSVFGKKITNYKPHFLSKPTSPTGDYRSKPINPRAQNKARHNEHSPLSSFSLFNSFKHATKPAPQSRNQRPSFSQQSFKQSSFLSEENHHRDHNQKESDPQSPSHATSSVKFITNGASLSTVTNHVMPDTKNQYY